MTKKYNTAHIAVNTNNSIKRNGGRENCATAEGEGQNGFRSEFADFASGKYQTVAIKVEA